jgi:hypothetical protein
MGLTYLHCQSRRCRLVNHIRHELMSSARLSPCGWTCVSGCGHVCVCPSFLFCCPPAVFVSPRARPVEALPLSSWVRTSAGLLLSQLGARWCVFRGSFPWGFFSASWFLVIGAFHVCPGLPTVALWVSWPVLLRFCVGRSSNPPQCVSHPLSVLHLARCLSPDAPPRR